MVNPKVPKLRLDKLLVDKGLCETRAQAQGLILSGNVLLGTQVADKPGLLCPPDVDITLKEKLKYVSRGGLKLEKALAVFQPPVTGRIALDVGASTGGFTDCLLQAGARKVYAVDVGYGQFDWRLRQDARVAVFEKTHIRDVVPEQLDPRPDLAVIDVSFISVLKVLPYVAALLDRGGSPEIIALIKPQFEYRDYCPPKGFNGVVTRPADLDRILNGVVDRLGTILPEWTLAGLIESAIRGPKGNREF